MDKPKESKITLLILRFNAFCLLIFMMYWIFSDAEFSDFVMINIPLFYLIHPCLYMSKKVVVLILPILFNIALWKINFKSYLFIRAVLYAELCRIVIVMLISYLGMIGNILYALPEFSLSAMLSTIYFIYLRYIIKKINSDKYQKKFNVNTKNELFIKNKIMAILVYTFVFILVCIENAVPLSVAPIKSYSLEKNQLPEGYVRYGETIELSPNKKIFLNIYQGKNNHNDVGIFYRDNGEKIKNMGFNDIEKCVFAPDNVSILIRRVKAEEKEMEFETWNIESGIREKEFLVPQNLLNTKEKKKFFVNKVYFSPSGKYFAAMGSGIELWNYKEEKLTAFYEAGKHIESLAWLSDQGYLVIQMPATIEKEAEKFVCWDEIGIDEKVIRHKKEEMTKDFREKINGLKQTNVAIKTGNQEKYAAIVISGVPKKGIWYMRGYVDIWNVEKEEKVFSLVSNYRILNVDYHPDGKQLLVLEQLRDDRGRIKIWNLETKECEKVVYIPKCSFIVDIAYIDDGKKAIQLQNPICVVDLEHN